jgi:cytochrome oxidase assembly protein ShyY1
MRAGRPSGKGQPAQAAIIGGLLLAFLLPTFISLGLWQWRKAEAKTTLQIGTRRVAAMTPPS